MIWRGPEPGNGSGDKEKGTYMRHINEVESKGLDWTGGAEGREEVKSNIYLGISGLETG